MSMSQEEIEALMNDSADIAPAAEAEPTEEAADDTPMSPDDIAALVAQSDTNADESEDDFLVVDEAESEEPAEEDGSIDDILGEIDGVTDDESEEPKEDSTPEVELPDDMDDILAGIDGITDDETVESTTDDTADVASNSTEASVTDILNEKINEGVYPLPVEKEHKVVNQLNQVAEDSEEKASRIFDVLSFVLDENNEIQKNTKDMGEFIEKQITLLEALSKKFPNIAVFNENLAIAQGLAVSSKDINQKIDAENNQIFEAMDLMQYHDINRQKIERVMAVIRKLSDYLNGIFEDENNKPEVQIAKHIAGDDAETVSNDDLDDLIAEFSK